MSATGRTSNYDLSTYNPSDVTTYDDYNQNMEKIDTALANKASTFQFDKLATKVSQLPNMFVTGIKGVITTDAGAKIELELTSNTGGVGYINFTLDSATASKAGLMSAEDKKKLDTIYSSINAMKEA